ncbi:hypothetical protein BGW42_007968 [Actinomortierella wolfii]|nr:hypothetical protein BGW42_007968 [Actinomortierella wolfii]
MAKTCTASSSTMSATRMKAMGFSASFSTSRSVLNHQGGAPKVAQANDYPFPLYFHLIPKETTTAATATPSPARWAVADGAFSAAESMSARSKLPVATYALSFLPTFPKHHRQVIGYHSQQQPTSPSDEQFVIRPNRFTENEAFNNVLHEVIQQHLVNDPDVRSVLQLQLEGWTHIPDYRNPAPYGRIPLPEDIFGSVQIVEGEIKPETYQRMPSHRIVSSNGLFVLSQYLHQQLLQHLRNL